MKPTLFLLLFIAGCTADKKGGVKMDGTYKMLSQSIKRGTVDSTSSVLKQLKIFTGDIMMYANFNTLDSSSSFGIGTYDVTKDTVTENVVFNATDSLKDEITRHYHLTVEKTETGFKQVIVGMGTGEQKYTLTEEYENTGANAKTKIDGAWILDDAYLVKGTDTVRNMRTQYKTYFAGYCIWANSTTDSTKRNHTSIGFGKFEMPADNKIKESMMESTYPEVRGHDFDIEIELNGKDAFKQTIANSDGTKSIEYYKRMVKE